MCLAAAVVVVAFVHSFHVLAWGAYGASTVASLDGTDTNEDATPGYNSRWCSPIFFSYMSNEILNRQHQICFTIKYTTYAPT